MPPVPTTPPPTFPIEHTAFLLPGPVGALEVVATPADADCTPVRGVAAICHPHPLHGGTMHNKVVTIVERALGELGLACVRFNFRGVGHSEGVHDEGRGEVDDLVAVVEWARRASPGDALWLAGFSFGSYVALAAAKRLGAAALISVAPPVGRWDFDTIELPDCPWLVVQGEEDEIVDPSAVFAWVATLPHPPQLVRMPETSHFFHRRLMDLRGAIKNAMRAHLPPPRAPA
ncbi:MAG TPA: alpha/beta fold hydrolase [Dokdonella sp.]|nr:alpha/beta fold hydrolase [Dokdonella sp.]